MDFANWTGTIYQRWHIEPSGAIDPATRKPCCYKISSKCDMALTDDGSFMHRPWTEANNQLWKFENMGGNGKWSVKNQATGRYLMNAVLYIARLDDFIAVQLYGSTPTPPVPLKPGPVPQQPNVQSYTINLDLTNRTAYSRHIYTQDMWIGTCPDNVYLGVVPAASRATFSYTSLRPVAYKVKDRFIQDCSQAHITLIPNVNWGPQTTLAITEILTN